MARDDTPASPENDEAVETAPDLQDIWSSIGPGSGTTKSDTPPTIRPYDLRGDGQGARHRESGHSSPGVEPVNMTQPTPDQSPTTPTPAAADDLRDELRLGVRMIEALESQLQRAERLVRLEEEASRRLEARLAAIDSIDDRIEEIEATVSTIERRLERKTSSGQNHGPRSGSLSIGDANDETPADDPIDQELLEQARTIQHDLRRELQAICTASATLTEVVEQADRTEATLRGTLETVSISGSETGSAAWTVSSILRRLASEFDVQAEGSASPPPSVVEIETTGDSMLNPRERAGTGTPGV